MDKVRIKAQFYGRVQGVGFRYTAKHAAGSLGLTGWVRNEYDGSVTAEVQGDRASIQEWIRMLGSGRFISIENIECEEIETVPDEHGFGVRY